LLQGIPVILEIIQAYRSSASAGVKMYMMKNPSIYVIENVHDEISQHLYEIENVHDEKSSIYVIEEQLILQFWAQFWCV
jgi:hypothetical protein